MKIRVVGRYDNPLWKKIRVVGRYSNPLWKRKSELLADTPILFGFFLISKQSVPDEIYRTDQIHKFCDLLTDISFYIFSEFFLNKNSCDPGVPIHNSFL